MMCIIEMFLFAKFVSEIVLLAKGVSDRSLSDRVKLAMKNCLLRMEKLPTQNVSYLKAA